MKKFLISVLLVLLVVLMYVLAIKNVQLKTASFEWKSKNDIRFIQAEHF